MGHPNPARGFPYFYLQGLEAFLSWRAGTSSYTYSQAEEVDGTRTDTGITLYADDITKTVIPGRGPEPYGGGGEARHLTALAQVSSSKLASSLDGIGVGLNEGKRVTLARLFGKGSIAQRRLLHAGTLRLSGQFGRFMRILGGWLTVQGSLQIEKGKRFQAGRTGLGIISNFLVHEAARGT